MRISDWSSDVCSSDLQAKRPTYGPPNWRPTPSDCPSPTTMSAPISPGDLMRPSATGSVTTAISSAPAAWQASASLVISSMRPRMSGYWTTTQLVSLSMLSVSAAQSVSASSAGSPSTSTSDLQSLMRISYAVFCLKKKNDRQETIMYTAT